jgi:TRAP-type mannitol/chloroaromatic compound transport system substrate-binding protein
VIVGAGVAGGALATVLARRGLDVFVLEKSLVHRDRVRGHDDQNPQALRRLVAAGAQLRAWPREVMQAAWRGSHELYEETASQNPRFRKVWESYRSYRDDQYQWFRVAENSSENFAYAAAQAR